MQHNDIYLKSLFVNLFYVSLFPCCQILQKHEILLSIFLKVDLKDHIKISK